MSKTVLEEAVLEMKQIKEAAEKAAMEKMVKTMPKEFDKFLNEELKKSTKESTNVDKKKESQKINESFMDNTEEPTLEERLANEEQPCCDDEVLDMTNLSLDDIESAYNNASSEDEIEVVNDSDMDSEMGMGMGSEMDSGLDSGMDAEMGQENGIINHDMLKDIEEELTQMGDESENVGDEVIGDNSEMEVSEPSADPYEFMKKMHEELTTAIGAIEERLSTEGHQKEFDGKMVEMYGETFKESMGDKYNEMFEMYKSKKMEEVKKADVNSPAVVEEKKVAKGKEEVSEVLAPEGHEEGKEVDEAHGISLSKNKQVSGNKTPRLDYKNYAKNKVRSAVQESSNTKKKMSSLLEENKKLTKKINESKGKVNQLTDVVGQYRTALEKYRKQLTEMAVFNNNLAHVNSILLSENFTLTSGEKKKIIDEFKKVSTLEESEKKYKEVISGISKRANMSESIEEKLNDSIQPSSANVLGNVVENTAYVNEHVTRLKKLMNYSGKK